MEDALLAILETFKVPVYRQGSMSDKDVYPETMITYWNNDSADHAYYDNKDFGTAWDFNIFVYSEDPAVPYTLIASIRAALKAAGWIVPSKGFDTASDTETHTARGLNCLYLEV